ncbi:MAG: pseudouridine synthase [Aerococcus suis]|nr:pseudouridine synthase [Aerococcus suis]
MHILDALSEGLQISKKRSKQLIRQQHVVLNGEIVSAFNLAVDANWDELMVNGQQVDFQKHHYWVVNKPTGCVSAKKDSQWPTVLDCFPSSYGPSQLSIVGRLDRDACGLMLLTDNGQLHYLLENPKFVVSKTYRVKVNGWLREDAIQIFQEGVVFLDGYQCQPSQLRILHQRLDESIAEVTIIEGKRHQVKKMFLSVGVKVTYLERIALGPLTLHSDLSRGKFRPLTANEARGLHQILQKYQKR